MDWDLTEKVLENLAYAHSRHGGRSHNHKEKHKRYERQKGEEKARRNRKSLARKTRRK
jgi:hypothetical protein